MQAEWFRPAGVELTRIIPWEEERAIPKQIKLAADKIEDQWDRNQYIEGAWKDAYHTERMDAILNAGRKWSDRQGFVERFGTDPCCIEVSSIILKDWKQLKNFFTKTDAYLHRHKMLRFSDEIGGTGGHIHLSVHNRLEGTFAKRLMLNHPEAMFAFAHPCDEQHYLENKNKNNIVEHPVMWWDMNSYNTDNRTDVKENPIAYRGNTVEFRLLDLAQTWEMQEEHMAFAQAFLKLALKKKLKPNKLLYRDAVEKRTVDQHIANFKGLIETLNLPWSRYKSYVGNIKTRFEFGTKNFENDDGDDD